ncbi:hypothetical protein [Sulfurisphaera ohwakuensis]|uniref:Sterol desaturase/sphingolipid hydroxylase (Fatty acid hydroxylase superfamily) n=1 Tax=Sulfurisphaera ohwakuensis TaxID=69656 RepID=A0A650CFS1_SULOH|nr:hypothetical protein [Sulfurisphaera ohwakuensis]MBB5254843.1 sterol desaturase/sphingolipid hydroxylase (fatty acid hydroxylase superfamily) [Sulfurisphaera ohwakuensis]QGR16387.1 hypothetical protein D1869_03600 [Sulfurisphaera ohwakuensis]
MENRRRRNDAAYFLIILTYVLAVVSHPSLISLIFLPVMILHAFTIDLILPKVLSRKIGAKDIAILAVNTIPYIYFFTPLILIPALAFLLSIVLSYTKSKILPQLIGTVGISLLYLPLVQIFGGINIVDIGVYLVWSTYTLTEAIYVEYKLPYRQVSIKQLRVSWLTSLLINVISIIIFPLFVLPLIEPTIRFMKPGEKLKAASQIKELGKKGLKRTILVFSLLLAIILIHLLIF